MKRFYDWQLRFAAFTEGRLGAPFVWGSNDCALFASDGVLAMTGVDIASAYRGRYTSERGALRLIKAGGGLGAMATKAVGEPIHKNLAQVGDLLLAEQEGRELLGLCNGGHMLAAGSLGSVVLPMSSVKLAWRV